MSGGMVVVAVAVSALLTVTACGPAAETRAGRESLFALADLAAQRVQVADAVAAAKWGTDAPIDDPVREQAVLRSAATKSARLAIDPATSIQIFTDQIEANKTVQYALYSYWNTHPDQVPSRRPDLGRIRPILDQITDRLLTQLKTTQHVRAGRDCGTQLAAARQQVKLARALDSLHDNALGQALESVCHVKATTPRPGPPTTTHAASSTGEPARNNKDHK
jgi:chorismate mutase